MYWFTLIQYNPFFFNIKEWINIKKNIKDTQTRKDFLFNWHSPDDKNNVLVLKKKFLDGINSNQNYIGWIQSFLPQNQDAVLIIGVMTIIEKTLSGVSIPDVLAYIYQRIGLDQF